MTELRKEEQTEYRAEPAHLAGKYLTFKLAEEEYGLEITKVQEIIGLMPITKVPRVPDYMPGGNKPARTHHSHRRPTGQVRPGAGGGYGKNVHHRCRGDVEQG